MSVERGADIVVDYLVKQRVPYLFGVCGHGIIGLLDAAYDRKDQISTITTHDERIADSWQTLSTGSPTSRWQPTHRAVRARSIWRWRLQRRSRTRPRSWRSRATCRPAIQSRSVSGDRPLLPGRLRLGDAAVRQAKLPGDEAEMLPLIMRQAYALMLTGRPGPVHVDIPLNVFVEETEVELEAAGQWAGAIGRPPAAETGALHEAIELLLAAERPLIVAGNGTHLAAGRDDLTAVAEMLQIPVITTPLGKGAIDENHRLALGPTGRNGTFAANKAARSCDVLLAIGTRFDDRATSSWIPGVTYSIPPTKLIHVDIDPQEIGRNYPPELGIVADGRAFLRQLLAAVGDRAAVTAQRNAGWVAATQDWKHTWTVDIETRQRDESIPIRPIGSWATSAMCSRMTQLSWPMSASITTGCSNSSKCPRAASSCSRGDSRRWIRYRRCARSEVCSSGATRPRGLRRRRFHDAFECRRNGGGVRAAGCLARVEQPRLCFYLRSATRLLREGDSDPVPQ